jgi:hypothetical protein
MEKYLELRVIQISRRAKQEDAQRKMSPMPFRRRAVTA